MDDEGHFEEKLLAQRKKTKKMNWQDESQTYEEGWRSLLALPLPLLLEFANALQVQLVKLE